MTYKLSKLKRVVLAIGSPLIFLMALLSTVSLFTSSDNLLKRLLAVICFYYVNYFFAVTATSISVDKEIICFNRMINKKRIETANILSIHKNKMIGCFIFKSTSDSIWVMTGIENIKVIIQAVKAKNPSVSVTM